MESTSKQSGNVERLRQEVERRLGQLRRELLTEIAGIDVEEGNAPIGASYVTATVSGALTDERVLTAGTNITVTDNGAGSTIVIDAAAGAPVNASYVCIANNATLTAERVLTEGNGIDITDAGANGNVTIAVDESELTATLIGGFTEAAQDAVGAMVADSATVSLTYVDGGPSLTAAVVNGSIGTTQLADEGVTLAKIQDITTGRVLGRTTALSGVIEELDVAAPLSLLTAGFLTTRIATNRLSGRSTAGSGVLEAITPGNGLVLAAGVLDVDALPTADIDRVIYEVNFSSLANNTFVNGNETIDGLTWVVANAAEMSTFDISNGNGLRAIVATSNGGASAMTSASQTASYLYLTLAQIPGFDASFDHIFEIYCSTIVQEANGEGVDVGLWGVAGTPNSTSIARLRGGSLANGTAFNRLLRSTTTGTTTEGSEDRSGHDVLSVRINGNGTGHVASGTWAGDWPVCTVGLAIITPTPLVVDPLNSPDVRFFIAFPSANDASPTTAHTVQRLRIRRAG